MTNRRQFVQSGIALSAGFAAPFALSARAGESDFRLGACLPLQRFLFDRRFAEAVETAQYAALDGVIATETSGDLTDLWVGCLDREWRHDTAALAGVTTRGALFVLATLAADRGMRVVYRGEHDVPCNGYAAHSIVGPSAVVSFAPDASDAGLWGPVLGAAMTQCPIGRTEAVRIELVTPDTRSASVRSEPLVSWIIAPRSLAAPI